MARESLRPPSQRMRARERLRTLQPTQGFDFCDEFEMYANHRGPDYVGMLPSQHFVYLHTHAAAQSLAECSRLHRHMCRVNSSHETGRASDEAFGLVSRVDAGVGIGENARK